MSKKIFVSLAIVGVVGAIVIGATVAYFTDTEKSIGNKFIAGKFNLKIDNTCHYNGRECICVTNPDNPHYGECYWDIGGNGHFGDGEVSEDNRCYCSWQEKDLKGNDVFFNFSDIKPGDEGEDTISFHIINNDAWLCAQIENLKNDDNGCEDPESEIDNTCGEGEGELGENLFFTIWKDDDCDNVLDEGEEVLVENELASEGLWPLADSTIREKPISGDTVVCYGIKWEVPLSTSNIIQTDSLEGDIKFIAVQARHMDNFRCSDLEEESECETNTDCDDGNMCTTDICENGVCVHNCNEGQICDDNNQYTINDKCQLVDGKCQCAGEEIECLSNIDCDDGNVCTIDVCNNGRCEYSCNTGMKCDDNNAFTINDQCVVTDEGCKCVGIPNNPGFCLSDSDCDDENKCTTDKCNNGFCFHISTNCDDGNVCTRDSCNPQTGECSHEPLSGRTCDDGNACTLIDMCQDGVCIGTQTKPCFDMNPCTEDRCNPITGECFFTCRVGSSCDDHNPFTRNDKCQLSNGRCVCKGD